MSANAKVSCGSCESPLSESASLPAELRQPCPKCGSKARKYALNTDGELGLFGRVRARGFRKHARKWFIEVFKGADWSNSLRRFMKKNRTIDREEEQYSERVVDPTTGTVLHDVKESLSKHKGHGSDRKTFPDA